MGWDHERFFATVPPLLHTAGDVHTDPMTDCLRELPKLTYTYWEQDHHGEAVLHEDLMKLFNRTTVWQSATEDESEAVWMLYPDDGFTWIKNIVWELNLVVSRGQGPAQRIQLITLDLQSLERSYKSPSITFWLDWFKETVLNHRQKDATKIDYG